MLDSLHDDQRDKIALSSEDLSTYIVYLSPLFSLYEILYPTKD